MAAEDGQASEESSDSEIVVVPLPILGTVPEDEDYEPADNEDNPEEQAELH